MAAGIGTLAVSFHGGATLPGINNVYAFSQGKAGRVMLGAPNAPDPGTMPVLSELRAFVASSDGSFLFVANGSKERNQVLRFTAGATGEPPWVFHDVYASDGLAHPFDLVHGFDGSLFVSNQDTDTVTCHATAGGPATTFATGFSAVRGLAFDGTYLYVADVGADTVSVYDGTGAKVGTIDVKRPVHLLFDASGWLWIGSERGKVAAARSQAVRRPRRRPPRRGVRLRHHQGAGRRRRQGGPRREHRPRSHGGPLPRRRPDDEERHAPRRQPRRAPHPRLPDRPLASLPVVEPTDLEDRVGQRHAAGRSRVRRRHRLALRRTAGQAGWAAGKVQLPSRTSGRGWYRRTA